MKNMNGVSPSLCIEKGEKEKQNRKLAPTT
jgi:hypothetical protein